MELLEDSKDCDVAEEESSDYAFKKYMAFQLKNLGGYEKIYPFALDTEVASARWQVYESIREQAHKVWVNQTGVNKEPEKKNVKQPDSKDMKVIMRNRQLAKAQTEKN